MPIITMPDINGAFSLTVTARFDTVIGGTGQTVFDFGDGTRQDDILLAQISNSATLEFVVFLGGQRHAISADDAIVAGESAQWTVAVDVAGVMSLSKAGSLLAQGQGAIPADVDRDTAQVGAANAADKGPLNGAVSSVEFDGTEFIEGITDTGTDEDDDLVGGDGADTLEGLEGNDSLTGQSGDDSLIGGAGDDTLRGGHGDDTLLGGAGNDEIEGLFGADEIDAGSGDDHVFARDGDDLVYGRGGLDTLIGGIGADTLFGGDGNDLLAGSQGDDEIHGGGGNDLVFIGNDEDSDRIFLDGGNDHIDGVSASSAFYAEGGDGNDLMTSGVGNDTLLGDGGNDTITANAGDDTLTGGAGNDTLNGGEGTDTAAFSGAQASYTLTVAPDGLSIEDRRAGENGVDQLIDIEFLDFDSNINDTPFDLARFAGPAGLSETELESFVELYIAYFNRAPDAVGLHFWGTAFATGSTLEQMATLFIDQDEFEAAYPEGTTNLAFAHSVYSNVLGRTPDQAGIDFWVGLLDQGAVERDQFILEVLRGARADPKPELGPDFVAQQEADQAYLTTKVDIGAYFAVHKGMSDVDDAMAAMALFTGSDASRDAAVAAIDGFFADAIVPTDGAFLMPLVGILDDPFSAA
jgi:Ca2+-binding RTX toxin-like protein